MCLFCFNKSIAIVVIVQNIKLQSGTTVIYYVQYVYINIIYDFN